MITFITFINFNWNGIAVISWNKISQNGGTKSVLLKPVYRTLIGSNQRRKKKTVAEDCLKWRFGFSIWILLHTSVVQTPFYIMGPQYYWIQKFSFWILCYKIFDTNLAYNKSNFIISPPQLKTFIRAYRLCLLWNYCFKKY